MTEVEQNESVQDNGETVRANAISFALREIQQRLQLINKLVDRGYSIEEVSVLLGIRVETLIFEQYIFHECIANLQSQDEENSEAE